MPAQLWSVNSLGGYSFSPNLSDTLRTAVQPMTKFRQFADAKDAGPDGTIGKGNLFHWNVYSDVGTQGTTLTETNTMPETQFTITQGTLTITEAGNSVPYSGLLDNLSEQPVKEIINKVLKNDCKKALDQLAYDQFAATPLIVVASSATGTPTLFTNGTATGVNTGGLVKAHVKWIVDTMKERNIPPYAGDDYMAIAWPTTFRLFKNELDSLHSYTETGFGMIMNGEIGRYENTRFVEQTNIAKAGWTNTDWCYFFGEDTVAEAICVPEEIRGKMPGDYGRDRGIAWYYLGGFGLVHSAAAQARIVKWASAS